MALYSTHNTDRVLYINNVCFDQVLKDEILLKCHNSFHQSYQGADYNCRFLLSRCCHLLFNHLVLCSLDSFLNPYVLCSALNHLHQSYRLFCLVSGTYPSLLMS